ncbi:MAG: DUF2795 domain-containing protein [Halodesulfurarchaeum sp.]
MNLKRTASRMETETYPITTEELLERIGNVELDLPNGREDLETILDRCGEESFDSATQAQLAIYGAVSEKALGRPGYSDRDPTPHGLETGEPVSF